MELRFVREKNALEISWIKGKINGTIPPYVHGDLYRNGGGMYEVGNYTYNHLFDGLAMIQHFRIAPHEVKYQRKYLQSDTYQKVSTAKAPVVGEFGTAAIPDPCKNIFKRFLTFFSARDMTDNTSVNIIPFNDKLYAATETKYWNQIDPETLDRNEKLDLKELTTVDMATAHAHIDTDGTVYNVGHVFTKGLPTVVTRMPRQTDLQVVGSKLDATENVVALVPSSFWTHVHYFHSFGMTKNYIIIIQQPLLMDIKRAALGYSATDALKWHPDMKTRFRMIHKQTGEQLNKHMVYEADGFFTFHTANAYEENDNIVMDLVWHKDAGIIDAFYLKNLSSEKVEETFKKIDNSVLKRFVFPVNVSEKAKNGNSSSSAPFHIFLKDGKVYCKAETICDVGLEFPQWNYAGYNGRKYRYVYGVGLHKGNRMTTSVVKINVDSKTYEEWSEAGCYVSEPVFIADPKGTAEDHGVLLVAVNKIHTKDLRSCFLLVLDATNMTSLAKVEFEGLDNFPRDFHGLFKSEIGKTK
ncbi:carotenoid-cleaving dioxygenase, mitochondrial-like [Dreissena polymorpha]|uniref:Uncharacterized protein n=1 Tax=Dreissena polymorpha TaxID=45954 RepID=A0A9D4JZ00_DREPO|nr:carotenoid-cleaving dioxygenase, mitochondrial-like [Dreissena polymorpha]KAH3825408.1 hypothetical protein DPMN_127283 [Dreissena polymorpha]